VTELKIGELYDLRDGKIIRLRLLICICIFVVFVFVLFLYCFAFNLIDIVIHIVMSNILLFLIFVVFCVVFNKRKRIILPSRKSYNSPILEYSMKVIPETRHSH
jgi:hypothetical protein